METMPLDPPTDLETSPELVLALLSAQAPDLAGLAIARLATGWDTDTYRLGERLLVRLPRHELAATLHAQEGRSLPALAPTLTAATPQPVVVGAPGPQFPHPWSVVEYLPGSPASEVPITESTRFAEGLADLLWSLHQPAPASAPVNPHRGGSLATPAADALVREHLARLADSGDAALADALEPRWEQWVAAPDFDGVDTWVHGDLQPDNIIVGDDGRLAGVVDWDDLTTGDPACDLATAWLTFDEAGRRAFTERVDQGDPTDAATWTRAKAWALHLGLGLASRPADHPGSAEVGLRTLGTLASVDI